ncbi:uncharacterized protein CTRU02_215444 [Colletotrichum truncatum]|uniref:Uncharacterized protein n=1 Tax=Colletotrichum truncatum TaxID=5467 RepID=A0ACC3YCJ7_COLTU|nr:uncharacterized protein CTRU02_05616 [Colletotrichum truncatum]KAF6794059.1 hypothetical protein CTRU02_05616 [Colletotrichum truncatum]
MASSKKLVCIKLYGTALHRVEGAREQPGGSHTTLTTMV